MNKRRMLLWMLPGLTFTAVVCAGTGMPRTVQLAPAAAPISGGKGIVRLVSRGHSVTVASTPRGPVYSATMTDGTVLARDLSLDELRLQQPDLFREISPTLAGAKSDDLGALGAIDTAE